MKRTTERTGQLTAKGPDGRQYQIEVYTQFLHLTTLDGKTERTIGMRSLQMAGKHVNVLDSHHLEVPETGLRLTLDHPIQL